MALYGLIILYTDSFYRFSTTWKMKSQTVRLAIQGKVTEHWVFPSDMLVRSYIILCKLANFRVGKGWRITFPTNPTFLAISSSSCDTNCTAYQSCNERASQCFVATCNRCVKVEIGSASYNGNCNKKLRGMFIAGYITLRKRLRNYETSCKTNCVV